MTLRMRRLSLCPARSGSLMVVGVGVPYQTEMLPPETPLGSGRDGFREVSLVLVS